MLETYQNLRNKVQTEGTARFDNVRKANDKMASEHKDMPMFADVSNMLFVVQASSGDELSPLETTADTNKLRELDQDYLARLAAGRFYAPDGTFTTRP